MGNDARLLISKVPNALWWCDVWIKIKSLLWGFLSTIQPVPADNSDLSKSILKSLLKFPNCSTVCTIS